MIDINISAWSTRTSQYLPGGTTGAVVPGGEFIEYAGNSRSEAISKKVS
jgi:hypothetical protein